MTGISLVRLCDCPSRAPEAAAWFSQKWNISRETYLERMARCLARPQGIPQWYLALGTDGSIVGGAGVIENDFHDRRDLTPNLCALYVEAPFRGRGLAGELLAFARREMSAGGVKRLYLATDLVSFYERYGWSYLTHARDDCGGTIRIYTVECRKIF